MAISSALPLLTDVYLIDYVSLPVRDEFKLTFCYVMFTPSPPPIPLFWPSLTPLVQIYLSPNLPLPLKSKMAAIIFANKYWALAHQNNASSAGYFDIISSYPSFVSVFFFSFVWKKNKFVGDLLCFPRIRYLVTSFNILPRRVYSMVEMKTYCQLTPFSISLFLSQSIFPRSSIHSQWGLDVDAAIWCKRQNCWNSNWSKCSGILKLLLGVFYKRNEPLLVSRFLKIPTSTVCKRMGSPWKRENDSYVVTAYFKDPSLICSHRYDSEAKYFGDRLLIQKSSKANGFVQVPLLERGLLGGMWTKGECFWSMGKWIMCFFFLLHVVCNLTC